MVVCTGIIFSNVQNSYKVTSSHVWYNSKIMVGKKSLFMKYWYEKNVKTVNDP